MSNFVELTVKCPVCKKGEVEAYCDSPGEGNAQGRCDECDEEIGFHYLIEIEGIYKNG